VNTLITKSRRVAMLAILSLIASMFLAMQATQPAKAVGATTLTFSSTNAADYSGVNALVGETTIDWAPWTTVSGLNAALLGVGSNNWLGRAGWGTHNFVVQDDGSGANNALWIHKAQAGVITSGMLVQNAPELSLVSPSNNVVTAKVLSQGASTSVRVRMTDSSNANSIFATATTSGTAAAWSNLTFTFSGANEPVRGTSYSKMWFEFDYAGAFSGTGHQDWGFGDGNWTNATSQVYLLDDVSFTSIIGCTVAATPTLASMNSDDSAGVSLVAFEGATSGIEKAPPGGSQGNSNAIRITKPAGAQPWAGVTILNSGCVTFGGSRITANVYAPAAGIPIRIALEGDSPQYNSDATTFKAGWQQLAWSVSGIAGFRGKVSIFPDFMNDASGKVFYFDDIAFNGATSPLWGNNLMNISQPTMNEADQGKYVHVRLQKTFIGSSYDASWWDGIREYRDADTRAYVKYLGARSTFSLTYKVTDANGAPMTNTPVELIVNANYSCSKATFTYGSTEIGRDDCGGKGETRLPKKNTDGNGEVTFVLTNTNAKGEAMPSSLSSPPTVGVANEIGSNIQPYVADKQGFDMLLVHFVEPTGGATLSGAASAEMNVNTKTPVTFKLKDAKGAAIAGVDVKFVSDGVGSVGRTATTDADGNVSTFVNNSSDASGTQIVSATYVGTGGFPASASTVIQWTSTKPAVTAVGAKGMVTVTIKNGAGKNARISVAGSATVSRKLSSNSSVVKLRSSAGSKVVTVTIDGVATKLVVQVPK